MLGYAKLSLETKFDRTKSLKHHQYYWKGFSSMNQGVACVISVHLICIEVMNSAELIIFVVPSSAF